MSAHPSDDDLDIRPVSELTAQPIAWLVPDRFALGQVAIIDGDPGLGKSLIMLDLAARLSTGRPWPDGANHPSPEPAATIYLSAEDRDDDTITPRLQALGADLGRVFVYCCKDRLLHRPLAFPANIAFLGRTLAKTGARLVIIDPIVAFLDDSILSGSDQSIRRALYPLAELAKMYGCTIILIRHLNKKAGSRSLYRGGGSIGFVAACRSAWLVGLDPRHLPSVPLPSAHAERKDNVESLPLPSGEGAALPENADSPPVAPRRRTRGSRPR